MHLSHLARVKGAYNLLENNRTIITLFVAGFVLLGAAGCRGNGQATPIPEKLASAGSPTPGPTQTREGNAPDGTAAVETATAPPSSPTEPATAEPNSSPSSTPIQTATASVTPTETPSPTVTTTPTPTETPLPTPTETPAPPPPPVWLSYLNRFRAMADLPPLSDREAYTLGSSLHSRYMVVNDAPIAHSENKNNPLFDEAGDQAAENGNIFATSQIQADYLWSVNFWVSAPFHLIGMLDPGLNEVGYGNYNEAIGNINMAAVLDIRSDPRRSAGTTEYPIFFPGDGSETWVVRHSLFEWPDPYGSCPGYSRPSGAPIVLLLGDGSLTPRVTSHRFAKGDQPLESCLFDQTSYRNNNPFAQEVGRTILDESDAIVIIPREPLPIDETYAVQVVANGETYTWSFQTRKGPD